MSDLPDEYIPKPLRPGKRRMLVEYGFGYERTPNSFGMMKGPCTDIKPLLDHVPADPMDSPVIVRLNLDGTDQVIYRWKDSRWKKEPGV